MSNGPMELRRGHRGSEPLDTSNSKPPDNLSPADHPEQCPHNNQAAPHHPRPHRPHFGHLVYHQRQFRHDHNNDQQGHCKQQQPARTEFFAFGKDLFGSPCNRVAWCPVLLGNGGASVRLPLLSGSIRSFSRVSVFSDTPMPEFVRRGS